MGRFPRCLSPLFIYHPLVLSWPVNCWPVSASLASLAWPMPVYWTVDSARIVTAGKNAFPHCCVWVRSSLDKVFPATELRPFFSNTFSMPLYQLLVLVFCKQFCARSREMDIWKHKTVLQTRNSVKQFKEAFCTSNTCSGSIRGSDRYSEVKLSIAILFRCFFASSC